MSTVELVNPDKIFAHGVSPSMLELWLICRKRWYNNYIRGLKPGERSDPVMLWGTAWHRFMRDWYHPVSPRSLQECMEQFKVDFPSELDSDKRNQGLGLRLMQFYAKKYPKETEPFKVIHVEDGTKGGYEVEAPGLDVPIHVIVDSIVERNIGGLEILEHKTSSMLGRTFFDKFENNFQVYTQIYATQKVLGKRIEGVLINAIGAKKVINDDSMLRKPIEVSPSQLEYHIGKFTQIAQRMVSFVRENWQDPDRFEESTVGTSCCAFMRKCPYHNMCLYNDNLAFAEDMIARFKEKEGTSE